MNDDLASLDATAQAELVRRGDEGTLFRLAAELERGGRPWGTKKPPILANEVAPESP